MQIEEIKTEEETISNEDNLNLFNSIVMGKDVTEIIHTSRGDFKIKYPRLKDLETIGRKTAYKTNGIPASCFDQNTFNLIQQISALDVLIIDGPAWFENAKRNKPTFSFGDIPDQEFLQEVYTLVYKFRFEVQEKIRVRKDEPNTKVVTNTNSDDFDISTSFKGLSGSK